MAESCYTALIGDLVGSRAAEARGALQEELTRALAAENERLGPAALAAPFRVTAGDEFQALFRRPEALVDALVAITERLFVAGQPVVFGLGHGQLSVGDPGPAPAQAAGPAGLDGPCFHRARAALERASKRRSWAACEGFGAAADAALEGLFELMGAVRAGWTAQQGIYVVETRRLGVQKEVAREREVSPSVVSESLRAARFEALRRGEDGARALLMETGAWSSS